MTDVRLALSMRALEVVVGGDEIQIEIEELGIVISLSLDDRAAQTLSDRRNFVLLCSLPPLGGVH